MGTIIVLLVLVIALIPAVRSAVKHVKGQGGCCGGGDAPEKKVKKQHLAKVEAVKTMEIHGMTCENCKRRVENALNSLDQVNAKVNLQKKEAVVKLGTAISEEELRNAVESCGYRVAGIHG